MSLSICGNVTERHGLSADLSAVADAEVEASAKVGARSAIVVPVDGGFASGCEGTTTGGTIAAEGGGAGVDGCGGAATAGGGSGGG
jgi:hypothetical protein